MPVLRAGLLRPARAGSLTLVLLALSVLVAGCGGSSEPAAPAAVPSGSSSSSSASADAGGGSFTNPVYDQNFPDPAVLRVGKTYYAYGTNGPAGNIPVLTSPDLVHWEPGDDALPAVGPWATQGNTWAPEVLAVGTTYVLYYTARATEADKQCIGRAVSASPTGPFVDKSTKPLVCQSTLGGSIDPNPFAAPDGTLHLYWKNDGNCCGKPVNLYEQALSPDGLSVTGTAHQLFGNTKQWQGNLIEAPEMVAHSGKLFLFYSANDYGSENYAVGYATCASAAGPCTDVSDEPFVASAGNAAGPGHCYVFTDAGGQSWMLYHAWSPDAIGSDTPGRQLWLDRLEWTSSGPRLDGPTSDAQPVPGSSS